MESLSRIPEHAGVRGKTFSGFPELSKLSDWMPIRNLYVLKK